MPRSSRAPGPRAWRGGICRSSPSLSVYARRMITRRALLPPLVVIAAGLVSPTSEAQLQHFATSELTIIGATGPHRFMVEVAETPTQMEQGLMFRRQLAENAG